MASSYTLGSHFESFVKTLVNSGRYSTASEVMRDGLRLLEEQEVLQQAKIRALRELVQHAGGTNDNLASEANQEIHDTGFARLQHPRAGDPGSDSRGLNLLNRGTEPVEVKIVEGDAGGPQRKGGFQLFEGADQQVNQGRA